VCSTCKSILPLISVDSEVVWGLEFDGKRKQQQDCPRYDLFFVVEVDPDLYLGV
jgi:histone-lysine N-methyltransferase SUV420H